MVLVVWQLYTAELFDTWATIGRENGATAVDIVTTCTEYTARTIAMAYKSFGPDVIGDVVLGGGGCRNPELVRRLKVNLKDALGYDVRVTAHEEHGINSDAKEAMAFALLGYLAMHGVPNNVPSCTGARERAVLGKLSLPPPLAGAGRWETKLTMLK